MTIAWVALILSGGWAVSHGLRSRARARLRVKVPPGIEEARFVRLGGLEQWITVRGRDSRNPLLIVLHGGPGSSYTVFTPYLQSWEEHFTVVQWDRPGVGKTLGRNGAGAVRSFTQLEEDCAELSTLLREHLPGRRQILLASSAGTAVGLPLVARRPELFDAFVATDFNAGSFASERLLLPRTLAWARTNAPRAIPFVEALDSDPRRWSAADYDRLMRLRDRQAGERGLSKTYGPKMLRSPIHSLKDIFDLIRGLGVSGRALNEELVRFDASAFRRIEIPVAVLQGECDDFTPPELAREWVEALDAPAKHFELLPGAGHLGGFLEPELFLARLRAALERFDTRRAPRSTPSAAAAGA